MEVASRDEIVVLASRKPKVKEMRIKKRIKKRNKRGTKKYENMDK